MCLRFLHARLTLVEDDIDLFEVCRHRVGVPIAFFRRPFDTRPFCRLAIQSVSLVYVTSVLHATRERVYIKVFPLLRFDIAYFQRTLLRSFVGIGLRISRRTLLIQLSIRLHGRGGLHGEGSRSLTRIRTRCRFAAIQGVIDHRVRSTYRTDRHLLTFVLIAEETALRSNNQVKFRIQFGIAVDQHLLFLFGLLTFTPTVASIVNELEAVRLHVHTTAVITRTDLAVDRIHIVAELIGKPTVGILIDTLSRVCAQEVRRDRVAFCILTDYRPCIDIYLTPLFRFVEAQTDTALQRFTIGVGIFLYFRLRTAAYGDRFHGGCRSEIQRSGVLARRGGRSRTVRGVVDMGIAATAYCFHRDGDTVHVIFKRLTRSHDQTRCHIAVGLNPHRITVTGSHFGKAAEGIACFVAQAQNQITVLTLYSTLITGGCSRLIAHRTLRVNTGEVTGIDHILDGCFMRYPVRIEHTRHARHTEQERVCLQQTILHLRLHRVTVAAKLTAVILAQERIVVIDKGHSVLSHTGTQHTACLTAVIIEGCNTVIERIVLTREIKRHRVTLCVVDGLLDSAYTGPQLHERDVRTACTVVVADMTCMEALAVVVTETVVVHHVDQPFGVSAAHLTYVLLVMRQVTCSGVVRLVLTVIARTVIRCSRSGIPALSSILFATLHVHLIRLAYPRAIRLIYTVLAEVLHCEVAPAAHGLEVVNHHVGYHFRTAVMECCNQRLQITTATPVAVLVRVLSRVITRSAGVCTRREPYQIEVCTDLTRLCDQGFPARVTVQIRSALRVVILVAVVIEALQQYIRTLTRNRTGRRRASTVFGYIYLIRAHDQLDIEIIGAVLRHFPFAIFNGKLIARRIEVHDPRRFCASIIQLYVLTCL